MKNAVIGGWQVNGIYTWQRGFPLTITAADVGGLNDTSGTNRANLVGDPNGADRTVTRWFNTAAYAQPAAGVLGDLGRNTERGPGVNNLDFALFKNFGISHDVRVQFRFESFNFVQPYPVRQREREPLLQQLRRRDVGASGPHQPAGFEVDLLDQESVAFVSSTPDVQHPTPRNPGWPRASRLGVGNWKLEVDALRVRIDMMTEWRVSFRVVGLVMIGALLHAGAGRVDAQQQPDQATLQRHASDGERALAEGRYAEAEAAYETLRRLSPATGRGPCAPGPDLLSAGQVR